MPHWSFVAATVRGEPLGELRNVRNRRLSFDLRGPASVTFELDGRDDDARMLRELQTDLLVYRGPERFFRGRVGSTDDALDPDRHRVSLSAVDYRGVLATRVEEPGRIFGIPSIWFQDDISWHLVQLAQSGQGGPLGITRGPERPARVERFEVVEADTPYVSVLDRFQDYAPDGFEWWIDADLAFHAVTWRGGEKQFPLAWGTTVVDMRRTLDTSLFANWVRVRGGRMPLPEEERMVPDHTQLPAQGDFMFDAWWVGTSRQDRYLVVWFGEAWYAQDDMPALVADRWAPDLDQRTEGRIARVVTNSDLLRQEAVNAAADALLADSLSPPAAYSCRLVPDYWQGPYDAWLGDRVPIVLRSGRLDVGTGAATTARITQVDISLDDEGNETVELTVGRVEGDTIPLGRSLVSVSTSLGRMGPRLDRPTPLGIGALTERVERLERRRIVGGGGGGGGGGGQEGPPGPPGDPGPPGTAAGFGTPTASATWLTSGSTPTASVSSSGPDTQRVFAFSFGIPIGPPGPAAGFGTPSASAFGLAAGSTPTVSVTMTGTDTARVFSFSFGVPAGQAGQAGQTGPPGAGVPTGGTVNQTLEKSSGTNFDTRWSTTRLPSRAIYRQMAANAGFTLQNPSNTLIPLGVDRTALTLTFGKVRGTDTRLILRLHATALLFSGNAQRINMGLNQGSSFYNVAQGFFPAVGARVSINGCVEVPNLAAGNYTFVPYLWVPGAAQVSFFPGDDFISYSIDEEWT